MKSFLLSIMASTLALTTTLAAQSLAGEWDATLNTPGGARTVRMVFQVSGDTVRGTVKRPTGDVSLLGTLKQNAVKFSYTINYEGSPLLVTVTATLAGDTMTGMADFGGMAEGEYSAKRVNGAPPPE